MRVTFRVKIALAITGLLLGVLCIAATIIVVKDIEIITAPPVQHCIDYPYIQGQNYTQLPHRECYPQK